MILKELIEELEKQDPTLVVKFGFGDSWHSDRGSYNNLAFTPKDSATVGEMLALAKSALGKVMTGWKGGDYDIHEYTDCYIGEWGDCGEGIGPLLMRYMLASARKQGEDRG